MLWPAVHAICWQYPSEQCKQGSCGCLAAEDRWGWEGKGPGSDVQRHSRLGYVGAIPRALAMVLNIVTSGHREAKAIRMLVAVSIVRGSNLEERQARCRELGAFAGAVAC